MPTTGRASAGGAADSPRHSSSARFADCLPSNSEAEYGAGRNGSAAGFHRSTSMPFRIPTSLSARCGQNSFEAEAELGCLNLARVVRADCRDQIALSDTRLQEAQRAPVLVSVEREPLDRKSERRGPVPGEEPLVGEVVDREDDRQRRQHRVSRAQGLRIHRCQTRLPVVRVHHVGPLARQDDQLERGPAQERETAGVVAVVAAACPVQPLSVVQLRAAHQDGAHVIRHAAHAERGRQPIRSKGNHRLTDRRAGRDSPVPGQHNRRAMAEAAECERQRSRDIGKASRLGERRGFGRDDED